MQSLSPTEVLLLIFALYHMQFRHYSLRIKISFKISFQCSLKLILIKKFHGTFSRVPWDFLNNIWTTPVVPWNSMEFCPDPKFHGIPWNFIHTPEFHGIPWNSMEFCPDPKFHGIPWNFFHTPEYHGIPWNSMELLIFPKKVPWNSMELQKSSMEFHAIPWNFFHTPEFHGTFNFPPKSSFFLSSMEFHGIPWNLINFISKKIIFLNIVFGIWLMIRCYLAKISQKRYILYWFQYRNSYFEHPSVSENGTRSAKMACCCKWIFFKHSKSENVAFENQSLYAASHNCIVANFVALC